MSEYKNHAEHQEHKHGKNGPQVGREKVLVIQVLLFNPVFYRHLKWSQRKGKYFLRFPEPPFQNHVSVLPQSVQFVPDPAVSIADAS
jgi:hypothetical protein